MDISINPSYFSPFSKGFKDATQNYKNLSTMQKVAVVAAACFAALLTPYLLCTGAFATFRKLVEVLHPAIVPSLSETLDNEENSRSKDFSSSSSSESESLKCNENGINLDLYEKPKPRTFEEKIEDFVSAFLHPYLTGQITAETDNPNRRPMIDELKETLGVTIENETEAVVQAYFAYVKTAVKGLFMMKRDRITLNPEQKDDQLKMCVNALCMALPKDIPGLNIKRSSIESDVDLHYKIQINEMYSQRCQLKELNKKLTAKISELNEKDRYYFLCSWRAF